MRRLAQRRFIPISFQKLISLTEMLRWELGAVLQESSMWFSTSQKQQNQTAPRPKPAKNAVENLEFWTVHTLGAHSLVYAFKKPCEELVDHLVKIQEGFPVTLATDTNKRTHDSKQLLSGSPQPTAQKWMRSHKPLAQLDVLPANSAPPVKVTLIRRSVLHQPRLPTPILQFFYDNTNSESTAQDQETKEGPTHMSP